MTLSRRAFLRSSGAAVGVVLGAPLAAQDRFDQAALLDFWPLGKVTLMHVGPLMGEVMPHYHRPPEVRIGVGDAAGKVPYLTGEAFRVRYGIGGRTPMDYAHTHEHFVEHARAYGKMGGVDRVATVSKAIRAERPGALFLTSYEECCASLRPVERTGWMRFFPAFAPDTSTSVDYLRSVQSAESEFAPYSLFERGGKRIAVVHHFGQDEPVLRSSASLRENDVDLVVCLSTLELEGCQALALAVPDLDIILARGLSYALPEPERIGKTWLFSSGAQGRFVTRIDVDVTEDGDIEIESKLIPIFSDLIMPDPQAKMVMETKRAKLPDTLQHVLGQADSLLYRRGALSSTWDDLICAALIEEVGVPLAFIAGVRWGRDILPGQDITREDLLALTGEQGAGTFRKDLTGQAIKDLLEKHAEQFFAADPAQRSDRDMLRAGGLGFELDVNAKPGARMSKMVLLNTNTRLEMDQTYAVAGWGFDAEGAAGAPLLTLLENYITKRGRVGTERVTAVSLKSTN